MASDHEHSVYMTVGPVEMEAIVSYSVTKGWRGDYTDPGYPAECDIDKVEVCIEEPGNPFLNRPATKRFEPAPAWLVEVIRRDPDINSDLIEAAGEDA